ncbi:TadE family protein [Pseudodesulfovibrio profundus]|uniref:TadE family protein n=1 Tax=Pseudodesulfovibrio profundus TaxID=57320 RepID=A0A2C8FDK3_9BACT|nr:TadE family protein [Pseudodesulfovibrio profundus]SOB60733.1 TadE family protein [Pseudodesulfovibrio profundus]
MRRNETHKQGVAIVEFALIMGILLVPLMAGVWDVSKFIDINQILTRAAREGVVLASRGKEPTETIQNYVESAGLDPSHLTVTITHGTDDINFGQEVSVVLTFDFSGYTIFPWEDIIPQGLSTAAFAKVE